MFVFLFIIYTPRKSGARLEEARNDGSTALHAAAAQGHASTCALLLEEGASPEATNAKGQTALDQALKSGHEAASVLRAKLGGEFAS